MDDIKYMPMATTIRHNELLTTLMNRIFPQKERKEVAAFQEQCALVYYGEKKMPVGFELVDTTKIEDTERFVDRITELEYVAPDFLLFKENPCIENKRGTRIAGQPDLIVEVWSESNTENDKAFLKQLYSSSPITEHWYIEQDDNKIKCYMGKDPLPDQFLTNVLKTQRGLEFDLRYLAIA